MAIIKYILDDKEWTRIQRIRFMQRLIAPLCLVVIALSLWGSYFCLSRILGVSIAFSINVLPSPGINMAKAEGLMMGITFFPFLALCLICASWIGRFLYLFRTGRLAEL